MRSEYEQLKKFLNTFTAIPDAQWEAFLPLVSRLKVSKGEHFLKLGDRTRDFGFVTSGLLRRYFVDAKGGEHNIYFASQGNLIGSYDSLRSNQSSSTGVEAIEDSVLLIMSYDDLLDLSEKYPAWRLASLKAAESILDFREKRESQFLTYSAAERYELFLRDYPGFIERIPQFHIATFLGVTPEGLSRLIKRVRKS